MCLTSQSVDENSITPFLDTANSILFLTKAHNVYGVGSRRAS